MILTQYHTEIQNRGISTIGASEIFPSIPHAPIPEVALYLVHDNDQKHTSRLAKRGMEENMPKKLLDWPCQSPDVNPIENLLDG